MRIVFQLLLVFTTAMLLAGASFADAPLKSSLGLNVEQAHQVKAIQKSFRRQFSSVRQQLHREQRKLRRAKNADDSALIDRLQHAVAELESQLRAVRTAENAQIRQLLTPGQQQQFDDVIRQRREAVGSSRDARIYKS